MRLPSWSMTFDRFLWSLYTRDNVNTIFLSFLAFLLIYKTNYKCWKKLFFCITFLIVSDLLLCSKLLCAVLAGEGAGFLIKKRKAATITRPPIIAIKVGSIHLSRNINSSSCGRCGHCWIYLNSTRRQIFAKTRTTTRHESFRGIGFEFRRREWPSTYSLANNTVVLTNTSLRNPKSV